ncbi:site-specific integrase (plasmid) [Cupriavidus sp. P-10]|uniref:tyrosine-type recombinase/integrase n=1 Tax=Cupriavidus sp. P-10 TaxID=2027911 RepID=UPI001F2DC052|nr:site-specific integrase [Cupriavidus sp. P-10]BDB30060.1 site-specific integrase [Cupriavidus sp. P-10]
MLPAEFSDAQWVRAWLDAKSAPGVGLRGTTLSQYELEGLRLLWYAKAIGRPLATWQVTHASDYLAFLGNPPTSAISTERARRTSPNWRPLHGPLSEASRRQSAVIVGTLFDWLVRVGALRINPFATVPRERVAAGRGSQRRFLEFDQIDAVFAAIERRAATTEWALLHRARDRWLVALLFLTGLRASEVTALTWSDFECQVGRSGPFWTVRIRHVKGGEDQLVPCDNVMGELARFRLLVGLPPTPSPADSMAVIPALGGGRQPARLPGPNPADHQRKLSRQLGTRQGIYAIVRIAFDEAADRLTSENRADDAARLRAASTHWLRHSHATHLLRAGVPVTDVQRALRHRDINTTRRYAHEALEDVARALAGKISSGT